jgi:hypothetical protein
MSVFTAFQNRLLAINASILADPLPDLAEDMARATQRLRTEYGDISRGAGNVHGIAVAVATYLKSRTLPESLRDLKYLCFGAASEYGIPLTRLIEEAALFQALLEAVDSLSGQPRAFRRCYQGLLKTYFRYPGHLESAKGRQNWLALRAFLARHGSALKKQKPPVAWTQALFEHRNLLGDHPCKPYGQRLLEGDNSPIEELKERLGIDGDTWIMQELILAPIEAAEKLPDEDFKPRILALVKTLEPYPLLMDRGLSSLLRRYVRCRDPSEHHTLRDAALRAWKSPWLEMNRPLWHAQIGEAATAMVSLWLKKRTIQDFFELLQADGQADRQRMEFWLQYAEFMEDIWLALGQHSLYNHRGDYRRIRQQMEGRYMALEGGGYAHDNAFLMRIGDYVFIEFGKPSNACHVFDAQRLPFTPRQKSVLGTQDGLKNKHHPGHRASLMHREGWQRDFAHFLSHHAGAAPGQDRKPNKLQPRRSVDTVQPSPARTPPPGGIDLDELRASCARLGHKVVVVDHRDQGGALWVLGSDFSSEVATVLRQAGFRFKSGKGWWLA